MTDPQAIAKGLSAYEREALKGRILYISKRDSLVAKGILTKDGGRNWTPIGLSVRKILEASHETL